MNHIIIKSLSKKPTVNSTKTWRFQERPGQNHTKWSVYMLNTYFHLIIHYLDKFITTKHLWFKLNWFLVILMVKICLKYQFQFNIFLWWHKSKIFLILLWIYLGVSRVIIIPQIIWYLQYAILLGHFAALYSVNLWQFFFEYSKDQYWNEWRDVPNQTWIPII